MRVATIDIGTNTTLLLVAEKTSDGSLVAVEEHATITRLGEGVDKTRALAPAAIARTNACLDRYAEIVSRLNVDRVAVVGTSAMRDAGGGEAVRAHVKAKLGVDARTISGDEEARLTFQGALSGIAEAKSGRHVVVFVPMSIVATRTLVELSLLDSLLYLMLPRFSISSTFGCTTSSTRRFFFLSSSVCCATVPAIGSYSA